MEPLNSGKSPPNEQDVLRESEQRFRAIYEQAPIGMTLVDIRTGRFVESNAKFCEIAGRSEEELSKLDFMALTYEEDREPNRKGLEDLRLGLIRSFEMEKRYVRPDGSLVWISITSVPMWAEGGEPEFYMGLVEDISERKVVEEERQRQAAFDQLITGVLGRFAFCTGTEIDREIRQSLEKVGNFLGCEDTFVTLMSPGLEHWSVVYGWAESGKTNFGEVYTNVLAGQFPWMEQRLFSGEAVQIGGPDDWPPEAAAEREFCLKEGVESLLAVPLRGLGGQVRGSVGLRTFARRIQWTEGDVRRIRIVADAIAGALERKRVEAALYGSRQMLKLVLDTIPQRVFWKDLELKFMGCNLPFAQDVGLDSPDEIVGKNDTDFYPPEDVRMYNADDLAVIRSGIPKIGYEEWEKRVDGTTIWLRTSKMPLRDANDRIFGVLGIAEDTTDLRRTHMAMEQAREVAVAANKAKDQFIAVLSHELRTPLTPVLAMVTALEESEHLPDQWRKDFLTIHRNVELEARLIDDLLDVTRISQGKLILKPELVDTHSCLRTALHICAAELEAKRQKLTLDLAAECHCVKADPARIRQVFWNLIKNAVKFTPEGGQIEIRSYNEGERLKIAVSDNGIGIEPDALPRVFNAFEQGERRFGGLGLGLSIAKALVDMHKGTLTATSAGRNQGATFTLDLATVDECPVQVPLPQIPTLKTGRPRRVLLVEDHEDTLQILSRLLRKWGYCVTTAGNVRSALQQAEEGEFDILISDLGLPDGSGLDVVRRIKGRMPAIALSGYGTDEDIRTSLEAGFSEHLTKPVSFRALRAVLEQWLPG